jgi:ferredoxin hydrogenase large subunit
MMLAKGRLQEDFIEGMACPGGCSHGPSAHDTSRKAMKVRDQMIEAADGRTISENLDQYDLSKFSMHREGPLPVPLKKPAE